MCRVKTIWNPRDSFVKTLPQGAVVTARLVRSHTATYVAKIRLGCPETAIMCDTAGDHC